MIIFIDESGIDKLVEHTSVVFVYLEVKNLEKFNHEVEVIEKRLE